MDPAPAWTISADSLPRADLADGDRRDTAVPAPLGHPLMATTAPYNPQAQAHAHAHGARPHKHHQYAANTQAPADLYQYQLHHPQPPPPPPSPYGVPQQQQEPSGGLRSPATQPWAGGPASDAHAPAHPSIAPTRADVPFRGDAASRGPPVRPPNAPITVPRSSDATTGYALAQPSHASPPPSRTSTAVRSTGIVAPAAVAPLARAPSVTGRGAPLPPQTQAQLPPREHAGPPPFHHPPQVPAGPPGYPPAAYGYGPADPYGPPPPPGPPGAPAPGYHAGYPHDASYTVPAPPPDHFADVLFDLHHLVRVVCLLRDRIHGPPPPPDSPAVVAYGRTRYTDARAVRAHLDEAHATASRLFMRVDDWYEHMLAPWIPPPPTPHGMPRAPGGHQGYAPGYAMPPPPLSQQQQQHFAVDGGPGWVPAGPAATAAISPPPDIDEEGLQPPPLPRFLGGPPPGAAGYRPPTAGPGSQGYSDPRAPSLGSPEDLPVRDRDRPRFDAPYHSHQVHGDLASPTPLAASVPVPAQENSRPWPDAHNGARGSAFGGNGMQFAAHHVLTPQEPPALDLSNRIPPIQSPPGARYVPATGTSAEAPATVAAVNPVQMTVQGGEMTGGQAMDEDMGGDDGEEDDDHDDHDDEDDDEDEAHTRRKRARKIGHPAVGHCLSCKTTEAPEWRRGPMGRGTLCNACGLHWAKLRRKLGDNSPMRGPTPGASGVSASTAAAATMATTTAPSSSSLPRVPTSSDSSSPAANPAAATAGDPADAPPRAARGAGGGRRTLSTTRRAAGARDRPAPAQEDE
ncbi:hypothetical protein AMAG_02241 [Allomyces macrogynus ATCC 38327]|uniref:GATA-type domain-containing protein n=1 Tax=Allomyces macrogynus (strain ATCC 38327) TaxID=578462 RepID=A0A0L0S1H6_ALLM3|nr:hypothetical protein AMAG_02241 [Allomyces macrogynus ATCC 38327]|eukprot:KNE56432.1 hypothetical protein AMAG_02241 [Allomyces macrogynus ATCC 38327]